MGTQVGAISALVSSQIKQNKDGECAAVILANMIEFCNGSFRLFNVLRND